MINLTLKDVYDCIPTLVTTFVAIIGKISILILFLDLLLYTDNNFFAISPLATSVGGFSNNLIISSILSLIIGSLLGLVQHRIKRLYAYSTISHLGFLLIALSVNTLQSTRAFFFYIIQYSILNLNAFIILITIGYSLFFYTNISNDLPFKLNKYSPIQYISQLKGYFYINPILAISLALTLFSFIGIPPLIGFFAKQMILSVAIDNGFFFVTFIAIFTSVISAVYYLFIVKLIFFHSPVYKINLKFINYLFNSSGFTSYINHYKSDNYLTNFNHIYTHPGLSHIKLSSYLSFAISLFTLFGFLFMFFDQQVLYIINLSLPIF